MTSCIFCKIINRDLPAEIIYEDEEVIVFKDIKPVAAIHLLILPKKHIISVNQIEDEDKELIGQLFLTAKRIAVEQGLVKNGYRLVVNIGQDAGQVVDHLHLHLLGGEKLPSKITKN